MLTAKATNEKQFELAPEGTHIARCIQIVDLGTQSVEFNGEKKEQHKARITWELPNEQRVFKEENGEQPFLVSKEFTVSLSDKANLRKVLESWRGKAFEENELQGFDVMNVLGVPCMLQIIHKTSKSGNKYAEISSVMKLMKGTVCPNQINPSTSLSFEDWNETIFNGLNEWLRDKIKLSPEYRQLREPENTHIQDNDITGGRNDDGDGLPF